MARRRKGRLVAMLLALAAVLSLAACGGPNFDALKDDLKFGDEEISDVMTTYSMKIPQNKPGKLIRSPQYAWANKNQGNAIAAAGSAKVYFVANPSAQCDALNATNSQISDDDASEGSGTWTYVSSTRSCDKQRKLSWLEKTMWTMYEQQSGDTIDWLSTSRNTLVASSGTVSTLQNSVLPMYDAWDTNVNKYLNIAQGVLIVAAAISLMVLAARIVWQIGNGSAGMDGHLLGKIGWIFLGVFMGSSAASIALTFFKQAHMTKTVVNGVPTATRSIKSYVQLGKLVLIFVGTVVIAGALVDRSPLILLSGLGAMSAVLMLVFKDTILSFTAGVQISSNDMLRVGDWIEMPQVGADGFVVDIALHTVKVQNWDKTITTIPTWRLMSESFKNWRGMFSSGGRRIKRMLRLDTNLVRFLSPQEIDRLARIALLQPYLSGKKQDVQQTNEALRERLGDHAAEPANQRRLTNIGTFRAYVDAYLRAHPGIHLEVSTQDGMADIVGFGDYGVIVALSDGDSFEAPGYPDEFLF